MPIKLKLKAPVAPDIQLEPAHVSLEHNRDPFQESPSVFDDTSFDDRQNKPSTFQKVMNFLGMGTRIGGSFATQEGGPTGALKGTIAESGAQVLENMGRIGEVPGAVKDLMTPGPAGYENYVSRSKDAGFAQGAKDSLKRIGAEAAISSIPLNKTLDAGRFSMSAAKTAGLSGSGEALREKARGEDLNYDSILKSTLLGGAVGGVIGKTSHPNTPLSLPGNQLASEFDQMVGSNKYPTRESYTASKIKANPPQAPSNVYPPADLPFDIKNPEQKAQYEKLNGLFRTGMGRADSREAEFIKQNTARTAAEDQARLADEVAQRREEAGFTEARPSYTETTVGKPGKGESTTERISYVNPEQEAAKEAEKVAKAAARKKGNQSPPPNVDDNSIPVTPPPMRPSGGGAAIVPEVLGKEPPSLDELERLLRVQRVVDKVVERKNTFDVTPTSASSTPMNPPSRLELPSSPIGDAEDAYAEASRMFGVPSKKAPTSRIKLRTPKTQAGFDKKVNELIPATPEAPPVQAQVSEPPVAPIEEPDNFADMTMDEAAPLGEADVPEPPFAPPTSTPFNGLFPEGKSYLDMIGGAYRGAKEEKNPLSKLFGKQLRKGAEAAGLPTGKAAKVAPPVVPESAPAMNQPEPEWKSPVSPIQEGEVVTPTSGDWVENERLLAEARAKGPDALEAEATRQQIEHFNQWMATNPEVPQVPLIERPVEAPQTPTAQDVLTQNPPPSSVVAPGHPGMVGKLEAKPKPKLVKTPKAPKDPMAGLGVSDDVDIPAPSKVPPGASQPKVVDKGFIETLRNLGATNQQILDNSRSTEKLEQLFKDLLDNQKGAITNNPELMLAMGLSGAGAAAGALHDPKHPFQGAAQGAAIGLGLGTVPMVSRAATKMVMDLPNQVAKHGVNGVAYKLAEELPHIIRGNLLGSGPGMAANAAVGPLGSGLQGAIELAIGGDPRGMEALKLLLTPSSYKDIPGAWNEAGGLVETAERRATGGELSGFQRAMSRPGQVLTTGDLTIRNILKKAGLSDDEARAITMTNEPDSQIGKTVANFQRTGGPWGNLMALFARTPMNMLEQGSQRFPVLGAAYLGAKKLSGSTNKPLSWRQIAAQQATSIPTAAASYEIGKETPKENRNVRRFVSNAGGRNALTANMFFALGQAMQKDNPGTGNVIAQTLGQGFALPQTDLIEDSVRGLGKILSGNTDKLDRPTGLWPKVIDEVFPPEEKTKKLPSRIKLKVRRP